MKKEEIQTLIDRYFEGDTTIEEERRLYAFFKQDRIPAEFAEYTGMFRDLAAVGDVPAPAVQKKPAFRMPIIWLRAAASAAAVVAIAFGVRLAGNISEENALARLYEGSYMIVDGQRIDDLSEIKDSIKATLHDASRLERRMASLQTVEGAEKDVLKNVSDPKLKKEIEQLLN